MPLSPEEQTLLEELNDEIKALKEEISSCKIGLKPAQVLKKEKFFIPLNNRLTGLEARRDRLEVKASAPKQQPQGIL